MIRKFSATAVQMASFNSFTSYCHHSLDNSGYNSLFFNPVRRPQLSEEELKKVQINQENWPEEFKNYDPMDPYKNFPDFIPGMPAYQYALMGIELGFVFVMWDVIFPRMI